MQEVDLQDSHYLLSGLLSAGEIESKDVEFISHIISNIDEYRKLNVICNVVTDDFNEVLGCSSVALENVKDHSRFPYVRDSER